LFLLGIVFLLGVTGKQLETFVKENISFSIILKDSQKEADARNLIKSLDKLPFIKSTEYISKEQAAKELEEELGENPETFLGFNPLQASIEVKIHSEYANPDSLRTIESKMNKYTAVDEILYRKDMMELVNQNMRKAELVLLGFALILIVISFVLISNTIRLMIYSKRFIIHTMKLVGATAGFVRAPFVRHYIANGIIASLLAIAMLGGTIYYLNETLRGFAFLLDIKSIVIVCVAIIAIGILLAITATCMAVNKYLRMNVDKLYYI
jgi:cell division transport system permease protein